MTNKRLGCLTPLGLIAALITLLLIAGASAAQGGRLFSPGALNAKQGTVHGGISSHEEIRGLCSACHTAPWDTRTMSSRCLDCHEEIAATVDSPTSLHGFLQLEKGSLECRDCHTEHHGAQAELTIMQVADFPHDGTGFSLAGHPQHADGQEFACPDCHTDYNGSPVNPICAECHNKLDPAYMTSHASLFGQECRACHDGVDTYGDTFDHNSLTFPLAGKHGLTACADCHQGMTTLAALRDTPSRCYDCHAEEDEHQGRFGTDCETCHIPEGWEQATFDHSRSAFPLTGAHITVPCETCHTSGQFQGMPVACSGCHAEPQSHAGMFGTECATCHSTDAWIPAGYNGPHTFPMNHGDATTCRDCHVGSLMQWTCYTCHDQAEIASEHNEEGIGDISNCLRCHPTGEEDEGGGDGGGGDD